MNRPLISLIVALLLAAPALAETVAPAPAKGRTTYSGEDIRIRQYGDTAVVAFRLVGTTGSGEKAEIVHYLDTGTFVKRTGEWRAVAWQSTRVP